MRHEIRDSSSFSPEQRDGSVLEVSEFTGFRASFRLPVGSFGIGRPILVCETTDSSREERGRALERANAGLVIQVSVAVGNQR